MGCTHEPTFSFLQVTSAPDLFLLRISTAVSTCFVNSHTQESLGLGEEVAVPLCRKLVCLEKSYMTLNELLQCCKSFFHKEICPEYNTAANVIFKHSFENAVCIS